jgi:hypothetical protein
MSMRVIPEKRIVAHIKEGRDNWTLMQEYQLTYSELVLVFAALTDKGLLPARVVISSVEA